MPSDSIRIWRSPRSRFDDESLRGAEAYSDDELASIADQGFNAIWLHALLRDVAPTKVFPELGLRSSRHVRNLDTVIRRADRRGIGVYLYMQPPRGLPSRHPFWKAHPQAAGARYVYQGEPITAMCTSEPAVRVFLREAAEKLSDLLPRLAGAILITASEFVAHCYCKYNPQTRSGLSHARGELLSCPRCRERSACDVVGEVIRDVYDGFKAAGHGAEVIAWNWSWNMYAPDPSLPILRQLPKGIRLLIDFERGGYRDVLGKPRLIDEYSLSYVGPSERFMKTYRAAKRLGLRPMAKLQIGTTHELATVPNLALLGNLYDKARSLRRLKVDDFLGTWSFGCMASANTAGFVQFMQIHRPRDRRRELERFAADYFPDCSAARVAHAWDQFAAAMEAYPFSMPFLYRSPMNYALVHPIKAGPLKGDSVGRSWQPDPRGDDLAPSLHGYTLAETIRGLRVLWQQWAKATTLLQAGLRGCRHPHATLELNAAITAGHVFRSCWNLYRAYQLRLRWNEAKAPQLQRIMTDERIHLQQVLPIVASDDRLGYHGECHVQFFDANGIRRKLRALGRALS